MFVFTDVFQCRCEFVSRESILIQSLVAASAAGQVHGQTSTGGTVILASNEEHS